MILQSEVGTYLLGSQLAYYRRHFREVNITDFPKRQNDIRSLKYCPLVWGTVLSGCCSISGVDLFSAMFPIDFC